MLRILVLYVSETTRNKKGKEKISIYKVCKDARCDFGKKKKSIRYEDVFLLREKFCPSLEVI